jgi:hypothetical protein
MRENRLVTPLTIFLLSWGLCHCVSLVPLALPLSTFSLRTLKTFLSFPSINFSYSSKFYFNFSLYAPSFFLSLLLHFFILSFYFLFCKFLFLFYCSFLLSLLLHFFIPSFYFFLFSKFLFLSYCSSVLPFFASQALKGSISLTFYHIQFKCGGSNSDTFLPMSFLFRLLCRRRKSPSFKSIHLVTLFQIFKLCHFCSDEMLSTMPVHLKS